MPEIHHPIRQQPQRPASPPLGRLRAGERHQACLDPPVQDPPPGLAVGLPGFFAMSATSSPSSTKRRLSLWPPCRRWSQGRLRSARQSRPSLPRRRVGLEQDAGVQQRAGVRPTAREERSDAFAFLVGQTDDVPLVHGEPPGRVVRTRAYAEELHPATEVCQRTSPRPRLRRRHLRPGTRAGLRLGVTTRRSIFTLRSGVWQTRCA